MMLGHGCMQDAEHGMRWRSNFKHCEQPAPRGLLPVAARGEARRRAAGEMHALWQDSLCTARTQRASGGSSET